MILILSSKFAEIWYNFQYYFKKESYTRPILLQYFHTIFFIAFTTREYSPQAGSPR